MDSEFSGRGHLFAVGDGPGVPTETSLNLFQSALILSNGFVRDPSVEAFTDALAFTNDTKWEERLRTFRAAKLSEAPAELVLDGVFSVIRYMEVFHELLAESDETVIVLKERIRELQRWRLDCGNLRIVERFNETLNAIGSAISDEATRSQMSMTSSEIKIHLIRSLRQLMIDWGAPPFSMQAGV